MVARHQTGEENGRVQPGLPSGTVTFLFTDVEGSTKLLYERGGCRHRIGGKAARVPSLATIGVYGWSFDRFLGALREADVGLLIDVRQRRGVRGREYAWANARRLQESLAAAGIAYAHHKELAPTTELRHVQYREDDRLGVGKRSRVRLAPAYRERYLREILDEVDRDSLCSLVPHDETVALLCVEREPEACHRSLVAARLEAACGATVVHLLP
jgi:uncharacterized protein (DUF488 family)